VKPDGNVEAVGVDVFEACAVVVRAEEPLQPAARQQTTRLTKDIFETPTRS
jgi:hypothetical protein